MYQYTWDEETGGLLLTTEQSKFSKEPRPVYYRELDILGFDRYWNYPKDDSAPLMWAEANNYIYRGRTVAKTKGGSLYTPPELVILDEPEPDGGMLRFVDIGAMTAKNSEVLETLVQETIRNVYNTYMTYRDKVDVFYVAFSGGKDSVAALDIVQRAIPHDSFMVMFGDTQMEFSDTYSLVEKQKSICEKEGIKFVVSKSEQTPEYTWNQFGPPATVTRWCCSVHKTAPQVLSLRKYTGKANFTGMAFIGVRASESVSRSEYDYISLGEKHKGQYSCNPILEWGSAELYLYIYSAKLMLNEAYKKGNRRVGCLVCPRAAERNEYMARVCYTTDFDAYIDTIKNMYKKSFPSEKQLDTFIANGGWKARKNGRDIDVQMNYTESISDDIHTIIITKAKTPWKQWIKTIGVLLNDSSPYTILFRKEQFLFNVIEHEDTIEVTYSSIIAKENPTFVKLLKNVFRKSACCVQCRECEADCHNGFISMKSGVLFIDDRCVHCSQCHKVEKGCLIYKSIEMPKGGLEMSATKSLNCYSHHAPKMEWFYQFFKYKNEFDQNHSLGSQMFSFFKRFLRDSDLIDATGYSKTANVIDKVGLDSEASWAIMLTNLTYSPQINWMIRRMKMNETYTKEYTLYLLVCDGAKESWVKDIWSSFSRLVELPFNKVGLGTANKENNKTISITRTPWSSPDPRVILYSLYKFAEKCGTYQFRLSTLLDDTIERDGISPTRIFGLDRDTMIALLNGLTVNYIEYIDASFTLGLETITLRSDKSSDDVLSLF